MQSLAVVFHSVVNIKADQIKLSGSLNLEIVLALVAACDKTLALPPNL